MSDNEMITCTFDHDPDTPVVKVPVDKVMCHNVDRVGYLTRELAEKTGHEWDRLVIIDPATGNPVRSINAHGGDTYSVVVAPPSPPGCSRGCRSRCLACAVGHRTRNE